MIWAGFSPGRSRTPYSALALTHSTIRPRWSGYLAILASKKPVAVFSVRSSSSASSR